MPPAYIRPGLQFPFFMCSRSIASLSRLLLLNLGTDSLCTMWYVKVTLPPHRSVPVETKRRRLVLLYATAHIPVGQRWRCGDRCFDDGNMVMRLGSSARYELNLPHPTAYAPRRTHTKPRWLPLPRMKSWWFGLYAGALYAS